MLQVHENLPQPQRLEQKILRFRTSISVRLAHDLSTSDVMGDLSRYVTDTPHNRSNRLLSFFSPDMTFLHYCTSTVRLSKDLFILIIELCLLPLLGLANTPHKHSPNLPIGEPRQREALAK